MNVEKMKELMQDRIVYNQKIISRIPSALRGLYLMKMPTIFCLPCSAIRLTN